MSTHYFLCPLIFPKESLGCSEGVHVGRQALLWGLHPSGPLQADWPRLLRGLNWRGEFSVRSM